MDVVRSVHNKVVEAKSESDWGAALTLLETIPAQAQLTRLPAAEMSLNTVAHIAALDNRIGILRALHSRNFDLRQRNARNLTPLTTAQRQRGNCLTVVKFLLEAVYSPVEQLFYGGDESDDKLHSLFGAYPEAINDGLEEYNAMTWLGVCVEEGRFDQARWLIAHGATTTTKDVCGNSLLHMFPFGAASSASWNDDTLDKVVAADSFDEDACLADGQRKLLAFLDDVLSIRDVAALIDSKNDMGDAAIHVAAEMSSDPRIALWALKVFKRHGAALELCNQDGSNVGMLLGRKFGDGPWLGLVFDSLACGLEREAEDLGGRRLKDYVEDADDELGSDDFSIDGECDDSSLDCDDHLAL